MADLQDFPAPLLEAVAGQAGGRLVLVVGAGCSMEYPTNLKSAAEYAEEAYNRLVQENVIRADDCEDSGDLSSVADSVVAAGHRQGELVRRLPTSEFQRAKPNKGYLRAAVLLREGIVDIVITLNYDLAIDAALSNVDGGIAVHSVSSADEFGMGTRSSVVFLHGHAYHPPDEWIIRTEDLERSWENDWEEVVADIAAAAPVTVFVGLGSPAQVFVNSVERLRNRVTTTDFFFVDPKPDDSRFLGEMQLDDDRCLAAGWNEFTEVLSERLMVEYRRVLQDAVDRICQQDTVASIEQESEDLCHSICELDIVEFGNLRAAWLSDTGLFWAWSDTQPEWLGIAIVAIAIVAKDAGADVSVNPHGIVNLKIGEKSRRVGVVHGRGAVSWVEARGIIEDRWEYNRAQARERPEYFLYDAFRHQSPEEIATPRSLIGDEDEQSIITGDRNYELIAIRQVLSE